MLTTIQTRDKLNAWLKRISPDADKQHDTSLSASILFVPGLEWSPLRRRGVSGERRVPHDQQRRRQGKQDIRQPEPADRAPDHRRQFGLRARCVVGVAMIKAHLRGPQRRADCQQVVGERIKTNRTVRGRSNTGIYG